MISAKIEMRQQARRLHESFETARGMKLRMKNEEMEELDYRPLAFGSCSTPSVLRAFKQRLFLGAIGGYAALNLVVGFLRNQLLLSRSSVEPKGRASMMLML